MKTQLPAVIASLRRRVAWPHWRPRPRNLKRDLKEQSTEGYWHRRARAHSRRFWFVAHRYRLEHHLTGARDRATIALGVIPSLLRAFACGGLLLVAVLAIEFSLARYVAPTLVPTGPPALLLKAFPTLAVQVSASLLGFYLASVSIVLGTSYHRVSAGVRALVLGNVRTKFYLESIGMAIGTGLALILLQSVGFVFGYMTVTIYALLVVFSGWAFVRLAFGAFNLFSPIALGEEPLRDLYRTIKRLDSNGLLGDEAVLQATARKANHALRILAELIDLARNRGSADRDGLADMVELLLGRVRFYAQRKYLLAPTSAWFMREPAYPKWVEANHSAVSLALLTSAPLEARMEPVTDWFERRSAELAAAALEACVVANDRDAALRITRAVAGTARTLAKFSHLNEAIAFSGIVSDRCWAIQSENATAVTIAAEPPGILTDLLLGWREAIASWPEEVRTVVATNRVGPREHEGSADSRLGTRLDCCATSAQGGSGRARNRRASYNSRLVLAVRIGGRVHPLSSRVRQATSRTTERLHWPSPRTIFTSRKGIGRWAGPPSALESRTCS